MQKGKSLFDALEKEVKEIKNVSNYLSIFEKDIVGAYPILFNLSKAKDYLYKKARDYFFFAVIPSIEIIKDKNLKKTHEKHLLRLQTILALHERFVNNTVDRHSNSASEDLTFNGYTLHEAIHLLENDLKNVIGISMDKFMGELKEVAQSPYRKIPNTIKLSNNKETIKIFWNANQLWKRARSIFIIPSFLGTTIQGLKAFKKYISANILIDDLLDVLDDYKHNRNTLPLFLWRTYSEEMIFSGWALDYVTKEIMGIILKLLDDSQKLFKTDSLNYSAEMAKILRGKYCEYFSQYL